MSRRIPPWREKADVPKSKSHVTHPQKKASSLYRQKPARNGSRPTADSSNIPDLPHAHLIAPAHFTLREDGSIAPVGQASSLSPSSPSTPDPRPSTAPALVFSSDSPFVRLYHGNSLELLDAIHARYGDAGRFDCIFADPPYFLSIAAH